MKTAGAWDGAMSRIHSWHWNRGDFDSQWRHICERLAADPASGELLSQTSFKEVRLLTVPAEGGEFRVAYKVYREKRLFRYLLRPSLAAREARGFDVVAELGIPAVEVLALGERRRLFDVVEAYFVTRFSEGAGTMDCFHKSPERHDLLLSLLRENIARLGRMHAAGYIHGGLHPRNILWRESADGAVESIWIDLATVRRVSLDRSGWKLILTDLSDLAEKFALTQPELDMLMAEYRKVCDLPVAYVTRSDHPYKLSRAVRR